MNKLSTEEARQGRRGKPVLMVLIGGLVLAGVLALILHPFEQGAGTIDNAAAISETAAAD
ncbi:hypothetical protein [Oricola sp.]|uniref:hypothetical protein n=1 Tax=Oricola sp. TaxID=1979950 RepID=UPI000C98E0C7|nr:hypothetical protein [Ahrensia sp.]